MAKYRHRIFEMYEDRDEAFLALTPKSAAIDGTAAAFPLPKDFSHIAVSRIGVVTHVQFKGTMATADHPEVELREDLARLADVLKINSKVLLDFTDVESFSPSCMESLIIFERKLRNRGSRTVLCSLAPDTRACFFEAR